MSQTILLVEDDSMLLEVLTSQLEDCGMSVLGATSVVEAQEILEDNSRVRLIISDLNLGDLSGLDLAQWVCDHDDKLIHSVPFVLMTGFAEAFDADRARSLHIKNFLAKPFDQELLIHTIHTLLVGEAEPAA